MRGGSAWPLLCSGARATPGSWHVLPRAATDELGARGHRPDCQASPAGAALAGYLTASGSGGASWLFGGPSLVGRPGLSAPPCSETGFLWRFGCGQRLRRFEARLRAPP